MALLCAACTRPVGDGFLCPYCVDRTADQLSSVGELCSELELTHARWDAIGIMTGRGGEKGLPFAAHASAARERLVSTVATWSRVVAMARQCVWDIPNTIAAVAAWLLRRLDWLRLMDIAGEAYNQIDAAVCAARRVIDRPTNRTSFFAGPCPEVRADSGYCGGEIYAHIPTRIGVDPALLRCKNPECRRHSEPWTTDQWMRAGKMILMRKEQLERVRLRYT